ncbi:MAG: SusC/RagA family TonB-linked outer membrane protein, partial [Alloprevotella sp.]|nr:SusC/RagA family TonB-linked outer membrane protein [Alloprevotella sp.]
MIKPMLSARAMLLVAMLTGGVGSFVPTSVHAATSNVQQKNVLKGRVIDATGEPAVGAYVIVVGTSTGTTTELNGSFTLKNVKPGASIKVSLIGYKSQTVKWDGSSELNFTLEEETSNLNEVVVTAMGITRKASSLTYSTQMLRSDELMKVQDPNLVNSIEGKISGVTITPSAGGAGGASKITLRGNKSIQGNNAPLIVVDGVPMTNNVRGQANQAYNLTYSSVAEGSDPLSMINPDDIESMNILKGANAAALYGSAAANGVVMITTKKGKEGKLDVNFTSNVTFENPLLTPRLQNAYGAEVTSGGLTLDSWGAKLPGGGAYTASVNAAPTIGGTRDIHLRNSANDDIANFFRTGLTANNSVSLSGGTEKIKTYFSVANSHSNGMLESNNYNRNTLSFRQSYNFWNRVNIDVNANYVQTKTNNRIGGGTVGNPLYDLYTMPRNVDLAYYRNHISTLGNWQSAERSYFKADPVTGAYTETSGRSQLSGPLQEWAFQTAEKNNPYWLLNKNNSVSQDDRFYGNLQGRFDIYDGLAFQARVSIDHSRYSAEGKTYATTWGPQAMNDFGTYYLSNNRTNEIYTDYLLSYNKQIQDWSVSTTAGWVGHVIESTNVNTYTNASFDTSQSYILKELPTVINRFDPSSGGAGGTTKNTSSNWDKAALFTAQVGWKDMVYVDGSYRRDWYRTFRQFSALGTPDNYGYFGFGANAILSSLFNWKDEYVKYRVSYSEVGNSIPNVLFNSVTIDPRTGAASVLGYNNFWPIPEKTRSFETGVETQFFNNRLNVDLTYYNAAMHNSYLTIAASNGKSQPVNSGIIRNQGIEATVGYDWNNLIPGLRWKTSVNVSYNHNRVEKTYVEDGHNKEMALTVAGGKVQVNYKVGRPYGEMYVNDYTRWRDDVYRDENGGLNSEGRGKLIHKAGDIYINDQGQPSFDGKKRYVNSAGNVRVDKGGERFGLNVGNMNSNVQLSWSNTFFYKNFSLYFLVNGRIGGKVVSLTEGYLDRLGVSERTGEARRHAEATGLKAADGSWGLAINEGRDIVNGRKYYEAVGSSSAIDYIYDATNFRLRELSLGYNWRNLLGEGKNLSVSVIARNLFFIYKKAPVDPDISLSTANGLG